MKRTYKDLTNDDFACMREILITAPSRAITTRVSIREAKPNRRWRRVSDVHGNSCIVLIKSQ